ncbi:MAG: ACP phosphodiesterase [Saprospiraceae bacterium]
MNHLCHIFLSQDHDDLLFGNFIGDMIHPIEKADLPEMIKKGIKLHYFIDSSIDTHPVYRSGIQLLRATQKKYSPVVIDIFYDFLLMDNWKEYSTLDYKEFRFGIYNKLAMANPFKSDHRLFQRIQNMIQKDFLSSYESSETIPQVFSFLKRRASFENNFDSALQDYHRLYPQLQIQFSEVFPEMIQKVANFKESLLKES